MFRIGKHIFDMDATHLSQLAQRENQNQHVNLDDLLEYMSAIRE